MRFKQYIEEETIAADVATYDKKIGDKGTTKQDSINITIDDPKFFGKIKEIANKYNLDIERPRKTLEKGDGVKLTGPTEKVNQAREELKSMGVE